MKDVNSSFFSDNENNLWNIKLDDNGNMIYSSMYSEHKWTREAKIDTNVLDFSVAIDERQYIHIVYKKKGEIKYCVWNRDQWLGKLLYEFGDHKVEELNLKISETSVNVFFLLSERNEPDLGKIIHCSFDSRNGDKEEESNFNIVAVIPVENTFGHCYQVESFNENEFYMCIKNYKDQKTDIMFCKYTNKEWSEPKKLYSLKGMEVKICSGMFENQIHILNLYKENNKYILEDIYFQSDRKLNYVTIYESNEKIDNILIIIKDSVFYSMWNEQETIVTSYFNEIWSIPVTIEKKYNEDLSLYKSIWLNWNNSKIKCNYVIGYMGEEVEFILPNYNKNIDLQKHNLKKHVKSELINNKGSEDNELRDSLCKTINLLKIEAQKKEDLCDELKGKLNNMVTKYKRLEVKLNNFKKTYHELQGEVLGIADRLEKSKSDKENVVKELQKSIDDKNTELLDLNNKYKEVQDDLDKKNTELLDLNNKYKEIQNDLDKKNNELNTLKKDKNTILLKLNKSEEEKKQIQLSLNNAINEKKESNIQLVKLNEEKEDVIKYLDIILKDRDEVRNALENTNKEMHIMNKQKDKLSAILEKANKENNNLKKELSMEINRSILSKILNRRE